MPNLIWAYFTISTVGSTVIPKPIPSLSMHKFSYVLGFLIPLMPKDF